MKAEVEYHCPNCGVAIDLPDRALPKEIRIHQDRGATKGDIIALLLIGGLILFVVGFIGAILSRSIMVG